MKSLVLLVAAALSAGPALAHTGEHLHVHPHDGSNWLMVVAALGIVAIGGRMAYVRTKAEARK